MKKVFAIILALTMVFSTQVFASSSSSAPKVVSSIPAKNSSSFSINGNISIKFSVNIKAGSKFSSITLKYSGKSVKISRKIANNLLKIDPIGSLKNKINYKLTIPVGAIVDKSGHKVTSTYILSFTTAPKATPTKRPTPKPTKLPTPTSSPTATPTVTPDPINWVLKYDETFDTPIDQPATWTRDTYTSTSPWYADATFGENGNYFLQGGTTFTTQLASFRSFRKSFTYGTDGWLTVEEYGRGSKTDTAPATGFGGNFTVDSGKAKLTSYRNTDAAIIRSTNALPSIYKIEVTVSNINFGGKTNDSWSYNGMYNGYKTSNRPNSAGPWDSSNMTDNSSEYENGMYFLCITDYANPAPHNNIFIHHHRKVVMDTDNNNYGSAGKDDAWSYIWNPSTHSAVMDGSHYVNMVWLDGSNFGSDNTGNDLVSYAGDQWMTGKNGTVFTDKYLENGSYVFTIQRNGTSYTTSMTGTFYYGGLRTYTATKKFTDVPATWHYNQTAAELQPGQNNQTKTYNKASFETWPTGSAYPDYFFFGDPHINYYEGTAEFDDVKLYLPQ